MNEVVLYIVEWSVPHKDYRLSKEFSSLRAAMAFKSCHSMVDGVSNVTVGDPIYCLNRGEECSGVVAYRMPLSGTGKSFPRCDNHWEERMDEEQRIRRDYPDSDTPPAWFDPSYAGERWNEDD